MSERPTLVHIPKLVHSPLRQRLAQALTLLSLASY